jgi:regulatory protein
LAGNAYVAALKMLARRELSEAQVRERLARRDHDPAEIDLAVARLKAERAIDDTRAAEAIARTETSVKRRGKLRVRLQIERAGIAPAIARQAIDSVFSALDDDTLIEAALAKRLRRGAIVSDDREFARLYRFLLGQGFDADRVIRALKARSVK